MTLVIKRPVVLAGMLITIFAGLVAGLLWLLPKPFTRFEFMTAGTVATVLTLGLTFLALTRGARSFRQNGGQATESLAKTRIVRKSEQSS